MARQHFTADFNDTAVHHADWIGEDTRPGELGRQL